MVAQSHGLPSAEQMPWPNCVIFSAVQWYSGRAAISPATTLVLPTLRECPPMTTRAIPVYFRSFAWLYKDGRSAEKPTRCQAGDADSAAKGRILQVIGVVPFARLKHVEYVNGPLVQVHPALHGDVAAL